jgi:P27 family predicted phage terminase small subunit
MPPKPTKIKLAEGNKGKRKLTPELEPQFKNEIPKPPAHLSEYAVEEWNDLSQIMHEAGVLTQVDGKAFAAYCDAYATWRKCCEEIKKGNNQLIYQDKRTGKFHPNPYTKISFEAMTKMLAFLVQFGLTPASRSKITIHDEKKEIDPFEKFQKEKEAMRGKLREVARTN